jgi:ubiquinone/menaquinone biosynthesis C-methylase UbiE
METKDYFSGHSKIYAAFRPSYPQALYDFILQHVSKKAVVWDCATGNGQVAKILSQYFEKVFATDISQQQLENAHQKDNIMYSVSAAERTSFEENEFDLITVGQALHWFNLAAFYNEVNRVGKDKSILAVWGYANCSVSEEVDKTFSDFYFNVVGPYWDNARRLVEEEYRNIPFPFEEIPSPKFEIKVEWNLHQFTGYLTSWSATQKYIKANQINPVDRMKENLKVYWPDQEVKPVTFPVFLKLGRVNK